MRVKEATETSHTWVRPASRRDREKVCRLLARAYQDEASLAHLFPEETRRIERMERFFGLLFDVNQPFGACDVTHNL